MALILNVYTNTNLFSDSSNRKPGGTQKDLQDPQSRSVFAVRIFLLSVIRVRERTFAATYPEYS